jgi:hypothetical protein
MIHMTAETFILDENDLRAIAIARGINVTDAILTVCLHTEDEQHSAPAEESNVVVEISRERSCAVVLPIPACRRRAA